MAQIVFSDGKTVNVSAETEMELRKAFAYKAPRVGDFIRIEGLPSIYMLAHSGDDFVILVNLNCGTNRSAALHVNDPYEISKGEMETLTNSWGKWEIVDKDYVKKNL